MSDKIVLGNLRVKCRFPMITLLKCSIHFKYGEYTRAEIEGITRGSEVKKNLADIAEENLEILCEGEKEERIFIGVIQSKEEDKTASYQYDLINRQTYVKTLDGREQENFYDGEGLRAGLSEDEKVSTFLFLNGEILTGCDRARKPVKRHLQGLGLSCVQILNDS